MSVLVPCPACRHCLKCRGHRYLTGSSPKVMCPECLGAGRKGPTATPPFCIICYRGRTTREKSAAWVLKHKV